MENHIQSDKILKQLEEARKALPSDAFLSKMDRMADAFGKVGEKLSPNILFMLAASFIILLAANFLIMNDHIVQDSLNETLIEGNSTYTMIPANSIYND